MGSFASRADILKIEGESLREERDVAHSIYDLQSRVRVAHGPRPAVSYQLSRGRRTRPKR